MEHKDTFSAIERFLDIGCLAFSDEARFVLYVLILAISTDRKCDTIRLRFTNHDNSEMFDAVKLGIELAIKELFNHCDIRTKTGSFRLICDIEIAGLEHGVSAAIGISPCLIDWSVYYIGKKYKDGTKAVKKRADKIRRTVDFTRAFNYSEKAIKYSYETTRRLS